LALKVGYPEEIQEDWKVYDWAKKHKLADKYYALKIGSIGKCRTYVPSDEVKL